MNKLFNNSIIVLVTLALAFVAGCASWSGPRGRGHSGPFEWNAEADTAMSQCQDSRSRQRRELLCDAGILRGARCEGTEVTVNVRDSFRFVCEQYDRRVTAGETRDISREACDRMLAADGIPADATGTVRSDVPTTADPMMQRIIAMNPALWQDDHAFCIAITTGYGTPTAGGIGLGSVGGIGGIGSPLGVGGGVPGLSVGFLGSTVGVGGVGGMGIPVGGTVSNYTFNTTRNPYAVRVTMTPVGGVGAGSTFIVPPRSRFPVPVSRAIRYHVARECVDPVTGIVTARLPDVIIDPTQAAFPMALTQYICESPAHRL